MARVTNSEVEEIFDTDLSTTSLDAWIDIASEVVDDIDSNSDSITDARLKQIELLLSAGYAATQDPRITSASRETASVNYQRQSEYPNEYIAQAVSLDPTGVVASQYKRTATLSVPDARNINE
jgi:hypothetical protein